MNFYRFLNKGYVTYKDTQKLYFHKGCVNRKDLCSTKDTYRFKYLYKEIKEISRELLIHNAIEKPCVVRLTDPCVIRLAVTRDGKHVAKTLFGGDSLWVNCDTTAISSINNVLTSLKEHEDENHAQPGILIMEGYGVFISGNDEEELIENIDYIEKKVKNHFAIKEAKQLPSNVKLSEFLPALRMLLMDGKTGILKYKYDEKLDFVLSNEERFHKVTQRVMYGFKHLRKKPLLYIEDCNGDVLENVKEKLEQYKEKHGFSPDVVAIKKVGLFVFGESSYLAFCRMDELYQNICVYSDNNKLAGPEYTQRDNKIKQVKSEIEDKICIITGSAQGFGYGIAEYLLAKGANVVIADINIDLAKQAAEKLANQFGMYNVLAVKVDVSDEESVKNMVDDTVKFFGGLDVLISNAGVLKAGSLEEMDAESFSFVTKINYIGYFICAKYGSAPMKIQHTYKPDYYMDVIQINSKSGLSGSNKNFAYAGGKFGGIGLTQSFALELVPYNIKVNAICPGNLLDGPLWSDPDKGLFVQYLNTGKVPGAKTIDDVREFYEAKVPMHRGCRTEDVAKAILYCVDQKYETGQAIPVTGGQNMLK